MLQLLPESVSDEPTTVTAWERDAIKRHPAMLFTPLSQTWGLKYHTVLVYCCSNSQHSFSQKVRNHIIPLVSSPDLTLSQGEMV